MKKTGAAFLGLLLAVGGCASAHALAKITADFSRSGLVRSEPQRAKLERAMTDDDIARLLDVDVRAKLPTALAVAKVRSHCNGYQPYLAKLDATELQAWEKTLKHTPQIRSIQPISALTHSEQHPTLHSMRTAAAKLNCELLLVYLQADASVDNRNDASVLYWTILGLWLVPGNTMEHKTVMQAVLVDCRTGMVLGTATGDAHLTKHYPAAFKDVREAELARQVPAEALADLREGVRRLLPNVVAAALAAKR